jgi:hypothetical protein
MCSIVCWGCAMPEVSPNIKWLSSCCVGWSINLSIFIFLASHLWRNNLGPHSWKWHVHQGGKGEGPVAWLWLSYDSNVVTNRQDALAECTEEGTLPSLRMDSIISLCSACMQHSILHCKTRVLERQMTGLFSLLELWRMVLCCSTTGLGRGWCLLHRDNPLTMRGKKWTTAKCEPLTKLQSSNSSRLGERLDLQLYTPLTALLRTAYISR